MILYNKSIEDHTLTLGGKGQKLVQLQQHGFNVPTFCIISAEYLQGLLPVNLHTATDIQKINKAIQQVVIPKKDLLSIQNYFGGTINYLAVRSSGADEDGSQFSFAGQFETFLYVEKTALEKRIKAVWQSAFSERVLKYRKQNNLPLIAPIAIVVQKMVHADVAGVAFGANPMTGNRQEKIISSVYGLGEGLVSGLLDADNYTLNSNNEVTIQLAQKEKKMIQSFDGSGTDLVDLSSEQINASSLNTKQIEQVATTLDRLLKIYQTPQDIEFAFEANELFILQTRPITNLPAEKTGQRIVWDNSNIVESYPGVTTPLTYSFIKKMYEVVYIQFSELMGVPITVITANNETYKNMLGLIKGRVYYNLLSWYQALALLPGYHFNAEFMEGMMGVKERFELAEQEQPSKGKTYWRLFITIIKMIGAFIRLPKERTKFQNFLQPILQKYKTTDFSKQSSASVWKAYQQFQQILTKEWKAPLTNDFFAMIFFGLLQKLIKKWKISSNENLHNDLLCGSHDIISTQPMKESLRIAKAIRVDQKMYALFQEDAKIVWTSLQKSKGIIYDQITDYIDRFGERCLEELKLETISYTQAPDRFIKILQSYINNDLALASLDRNNEQVNRQKAEAEVSQALKGKWFKQWIFNYVLKKSRDLVSNRENLRFERTRGFGVVRQLFSVLGMHFKKAGIIDNDRDIFYLQTEEIEAYITGNSVNANLRTLIVQRKAEFEGYKKEATPPERIVSYDLVYNERISENSITSNPSSDTLKGIACCHGQLQGKVNVIHSPEEISDLKGDIMVTSSTDPGWVSLFPTASAILVERGSLLSHTAIVARELGIPCIVGISGLLDHLKTGDLVEMDGATGFVKILKPIEQIA